MLLFTQLTIAQNTYFTELEISKTVWKNSKWNVSVSPYWKHIYNNIGWSRIGGNITATKPLGQWNLHAGIGNYYTFDKDIRNFYEFRLWVGVYLNTIINKQFIFKQRAKMELRNLFFDKAVDEEIDDSSYDRLRYWVNMETLLYNNETQNSKWKLDVFLEWYFVRNENTGERFASSRELGTKLKYQSSKNWEVAIGYKQEKFFKFSQNSDEKGHILFVEIRL